jgi:hypothetical protein
MRTGRKERIMGKHMAPIPVIIDTREPDEGNTRNIKGRYLFTKYHDVETQVKKLAFFFPTQVLTLQPALCRLSTYRGGL